MITFSPLPMRETLAFWENKVKLSPGRFARLKDDVKTHAFAVSGIARGAELDTVFNALQKALEEGISYGRFKKEAAEVFKRRGWTGQRAWRVNNIFRTNIQTAYGVGRYRQMQRVAKRRPYWMYDAVNDSRTRPAHGAMDGRVFPATHPVWDRWYPPNGFRCRCSVVSLSAAQVKARGLTVEEEDPTGKLYEPKDPATGVTMPARLMMPDPGFAHHPGKSVWGGVVDDATQMSAWKDMPNLKGPDAFRRRKLANVRPANIADLNEEMLLQTGLGNEAYRKEFARRYGEEKVVTDTAGEPVILSLRTFMADKQRGTWKFDKPGHGETIPMVEKMLTEPYEVWLVPQQDEKGKIRLTRRYIGLWKTADKKRVGGMAVMEVSGGVFQGVTHFMPRKRKGWDLRYLEKQRQGVLLWGKGK